MHMYLISAVGISMKSARGFSSRNAVESGGGSSSIFFFAAKITVTDCRKRSKEKSTIFGLCMALASY